MNKLTAISFILMVLYIFTIAIIAVVNHGNMILKAGLTKLNTYASTVFDALVIAGLVSLCVIIIIFILNRIKK